MPEYIERSKLMDYIELNAREHEESYDAWQILGDVEDFPAADVVAVVRCKECKWRRAKLAGDSWHEGEVFMHHCKQLGNIEVRLDDFCSYGERRGEDG